jgi:hypothetical protein
VRYYSVVITKSDNTPYLFKSLGGLALTSLLPNSPQNPTTGLTNPAALQIEFDLAIANVTDPDNSQGAMLRVWGLGLQDIGNAADLNGLNVSIFAGMARGLPLANPAQAGLILQGQVQQAFGNWIGTDQTVDMIFAQGGSAGTPDAPGNFPFTMAPGTPLGTAIQNTLAVAMPGIPVTVSVSPNLVLNYPQVGHYTTLERFASFVKALSLGIVGSASYDGVQITTNGASVTVFDGVGPTSGTNTKTIAFQDLLGQPTWIGPGTISFKTVLRADIHMGDTVTLPQTLFTQSTAANQRFLANPQNKLTFSGNYLIVQAHHYGHSRQPDASSWNTTFRAVPAIADTSGGAGGAP